MSLTPGKENQRRRITVAEVEADYFARLARWNRREKDHKRIKQLLKPMGFMNKKWEQLKAMIEPNDELWEYCSSKESWRQLMGSAGLELIRDGVVIARMMTEMN
jgi:hypothetical protein